MNGAEATADDTPISATWPLRRMKGKSALSTCSASSRAHPRRPELSVAVVRARHIGIVVAGNGGHPVGRPELLQPEARVLELLAHGDVREVAGDGDVVGLLRLQVGDQPVERFRRSSSAARLRRQLA